MTEENLHKNICNYIKLQYPNVLFNTDLSGINLTIGQAKKIKGLRSNSGFPDIFISEPKGMCLIEHEMCKSLKVFMFCGLYIELKKETPYKKNGMLKKSEHLEKQDKIHKELRARGYMACFCWSFEQSKKIIDDYLSIKNYNNG